MRARKRLRRSIALDVASAILIATIAALACATAIAQCAP